ncbi:hypothetical protein CH370_01830 [Leptospira kmetyi]|nr:hypothetical protein CH370_01830 [Leptospira kmetyi]
MRTWEIEPTKEGIRKSFDCVLRGGAERRLPKQKRRRALKESLGNWKGVQEGKNHLRSETILIQNDPRRKGIIIGTMIRILKQHSIREALYTEI